MAEDHEHDDVGRRVEPDRLERAQHEVGPVAHHAEVVDAPSRLERLQHFGAPLGLLDAHAEHHRVAEHDHAPPSVGLVKLPTAAKAVAVGDDGDEPAARRGIPMLHGAGRPQAVAVRVPALEEIRAIADRRIGDGPQRACQAEGELGTRERHGEGRDGEQVRQPHGVTNTTPRRLEPAHG